MNRAPHDVVAICGTIICSVLLSPGAPPPNLSADELVRRTAAHEMAAASVSGHNQYRVEEHTTHGTETREVLETRNWSIDHLILKDGRPLTAAEQQHEQERLRGLYTNPARFEKFEKEQLQRKEHFRTIIAAFPQAFSCQYDMAGQKNRSNGLVRVKFWPNPKFVARSWELRPLQGMEGTLLIDPKAARLVQMEARFFRDVDFGGGILGCIDHGGSFAVEQQAIGDDHRAITSLELRFNKRVLMVKTRVDSVIKASEFHCIPEDMTLQQGLLEFLRPDQTKVASRDAGK